MKLWPTLPILLACIAIALLAWLAIYLLRDDGVPRAETDIRDITAQLLIYKVQNGSRPSTGKGLAALVTQPSGEPKPLKWRRLLLEVPVDPWGTPYQLRNPGMKSKSGYDVFSAGKDRKFGTEDDIGNW